MLCNVIREEKNNKKVKYKKLWQMVCSIVFCKKYFGLIEKYFYRKILIATILLKSENIELKLYTYRCKPVEQLLQLASYYICSTGLQQSVYGYKQWWKTIIIKIGWFLSKYQNMSFLCLHRYLLGINKV